MIFNLGPVDIVALIVLGLILFGPDKAPKIVREVMGFIRKVQEYAEHTRQEARRELGPEFQDFDFQDLNPRTFIRKQLNSHGDQLGLTEVAELRDELNRGVLTATSKAQAASANPQRTNTDRPPDVTPPSPGEPTPHGPDTARDPHPHRQLPDVPPSQAA